MEAGLHNKLLPSEMYEKSGRKEYQEFSLTEVCKAIYSAEDKKEKCLFRMEKKKFRSRPPTPAVLLATIPNAIGKPKSKTKKKKKDAENGSATVATTDTTPPVLNLATETGKKKKG